MTGTNVPNYLFVKPCVKRNTAFEKTRKKKTEKVNDVNKKTNNKKSQWNNSVTPINYKSLKNVVNRILTYRPVPDTTQMHKLLRSYATKKTMQT